MAHRRRCTLTRRVGLFTGRKLPHQRDMFVRGPRVGQMRARCTVFTVFPEI